MGRVQRQVEALGASPFVIAPGTAADAAAYRLRLRLRFPVLADAGGAVAERYGIGRWLFGMARQSALVVVDRGGTIAYRRVVDLPQRALDTEELLAVLRDLSTAGGFRL